MALKPRDRPVDAMRDADDCASRDHCRVRGALGFGEPAALGLQLEGIGRAALEDDHVGRARHDAQALKDRGLDAGFFALNSAEGNVKEERTRLRTPCKVLGRRFAWMDQAVFLWARTFQRAEASRHYCALRWHQIHA